MSEPVNNYQYGSDPKNIVRLTETEAYAVNNIRIEDFDPATGYGWVNVDEIDMDAYNIAAEILNEYIAEHGGAIDCTDEWMKDHDILTLID